jgi:BMFP domain-containing protein YqiC
VTRAGTYTPPAKYVSLLSALSRTDAEVQKKPIQQWIYETMNSSSDNREELDALVKILLEQQKQLEQRVDSLEKRLGMLEHATRMASWDCYMSL